MKGASREADLRVKGLGLKARFVLVMTFALLLVLLVMGYVIYTGTRRIVSNMEMDAISEGVRFTQEAHAHELEQRGLQHPSGVQMYPFRFDSGKTGTLYRYDGTGDPEQQSFELLVPDNQKVDLPLLQLIGAVLAVVVLVGAIVAMWVANQVSRPIQVLVHDVRQIAKGDLRHNVRAVGAGEIKLLARSIDRMARDLEVAHAEEVELSIQEHERELAAGVREILLPFAVPWVEGYDLGAALLASQEFGGDFHDFVVRVDGRVGLLVCDVGGSGIPAALVGATARSYLRSELERADDLLEGLRRVNRWLAGDVQRGRFVTALVALVDPSAGKAAVVSAGHKVPLLRCCAADGNLRTVHPDGIALGFDKGPIFDRRLQLVEVPIEPGDRLVLTNSAPVAIKNAEGREVGEKAFYARVHKHAHLHTDHFLKNLKRDLEQYAGELGVKRDVSLVTISREA